ncbi:polyphenol oxidase family protein [Bifidobacterium sp. ESL0728]|uniref:polyphenol oxidase family protein n=1 Tax=Bifidobacterium sp. ESL0728 TaxID=2983220 RepID=UPI0023FA258B|nr:polyphenol oxidase family protein [Bifidobacterium sp. ESL0728]WEV59375.1 polyphenol oxidase family protein [Bifidobacterium sp. ESL0728]
MSKPLNEAPENGQYDDTILDSSAISPTDEAGNPIPVTIPIDLAPGIKVIYTTRLGGLSAGDWGDLNLGGKSGDNPATVKTNRMELAKAVGAPLSLVAQVHSGKAVDVDGFFECNAPYGCDFSGTIIGSGDDDGPKAYPRLDADAEVTTQKGIALGMFAADCLPVLLADSEAGVIGAAHCGRKGLQRGVIGAAVELMVAKGAKPERIVATLGPCICGDCYEVGDEIADEFDAQFPGTFTLTRFGGPGIDIAKAALQELAEAGIPADNVISSTPRVSAATQYLDQDAELAALCAADGEGSPDLAERIGEVRHSLCTLENPLWYSHRRAALAHKAHEGRLLALIVRE